MHRMTRNIRFIRPLGLEWTSSRVGRDVLAATCLSCSDHAFRVLKYMMELKSGLGLGSRNGVGRGSEGVGRKRVSIGVCNGFMNAHRHAPAHPNVAFDLANMLRRLELQFW